MKRYRIVEETKCGETMYSVQRFWRDFIFYGWDNLYMFDTLAEAEKRIEDIKNSKKTVVKEYKW